MRLSPRSRLRRVVPGGLLAAGLGVAAAALVACGDSNGLLSGGQSASLDDQLGAVSSAVEAKDCAAAAREVAQLRLRAARLPITVDRRLRSQLRGGADTVGIRALRACRKPVPTQETVTPTPPTTPPPPTTSVPTTPTVPTTSTTTPTTSTTPTTPPTTPRTTPTSPPSGGGAPPSGSGTGSVPKSPRD